MPEPLSVTLVDFVGSQMSDQGPVLFHFKSAEQSFILALPADQLTKLIVGAIAQMPPVMDQRGNPATLPMQVFPTDLVAGFYHLDGSMVLGLQLPKCGQLAFQLSAESREALMRSMAAHPGPDSGVKN